MVKPQQPGRSERAGEPGQAQPATPDVVNSGDGGPERSEPDMEVPESLRNWARYQVLELIGVGGMGRVYKAWDPQLKRNVALKFLRGGDAAVETRFEREAQAQARVHHKNVCAVYEVGRHDGHPYISLQLVDGRTLRDAAPGLDVRDCVRVMRDVAEAVHSAHRLSLVHRDIKPANILVEKSDEGWFPYVTDFGLARDLQGPGMTQAGAIIGTPQYMAPEQVRGETDKLGPRTDVYGLGATLYDALAGAPPFSGTSNLQTLYKSLNDDAPPLRKWKRDLPPALEAVVMKCLEKRPERRYGSARELADDLQRWLDGEPVLARPQGPLRRAFRRALRNHALLASLATLLVVGAVVGILAARDAGQPATVAVADFVNETHDADLDGLSGMLITSLEQSHRLSVLTRGRLRDLLRQHGGDGGEGPIDEAQGREAAKLANADALLVATIRKFDDLYRIELQAQDPRGAQPSLFTLNEEGHGKAAVPSLIDRLSEQARRRLRPRAPDSGTNVAAVTTESLEAYQHYFRGEDLIEKLRFREAQGAFRRAIEADPHFALAYYRLGYAAMWLKDAATALQNVDRAARLINRVPERERYLILAVRATLTGRGAEAVEEYRKCLQRFPQEKEATFNLGDLAFHSGHYGPAEAYLRRTIELDAANERSLQHLVWTFQLTGRQNEMVEMARLYAAKVNTPVAHGTLGRALAAAGRLAAAREAHAHARRLFPDSPLYASDLSALAAWQGDTVAAREAAAPLLADGQSWEARKLGLQALAEAQTVGGQANGAHQTLELLAAESMAAGDPEVAMVARAMQGFNAVHLTQDLKSARAAVEASHAQGLPDPLLGFVYPYIGEFTRYAAMLRSLGDTLTDLEVRAFTRRLHGEHPAAAEDFKELASRTPFQDVLLHEAAQSQLRSQQDEKAAETFRKVLDGWPNVTAPGLGLTVAVRHRALHGLSVALERLGQQRPALDAAEKLLARWEDADPTLPDLVDAKARVARLKGVAAK
jgi:tetratricopeptide (TPR) repeat protein